MSEQKILLGLVLSVAGVFLLSVVVWAAWGVSEIRRERSEEMPEKRRREQRDRWS